MAGLLCFAGRNAACRLRRDATRPFSAAAAGHFFDDLYSKAARSDTVHFLNDGFCWFHDATGWPWWAAVAGAGAILRFGVMLPAHVTSNKVAAKRRILHEDMAKTMVPTLKTAIFIRKSQLHWTEKEAQQKFSHFLFLCFPFRSPESKV